MKNGGYLLACYLILIHAYFLLNTYLPFLTYVLEIIMSYIYHAAKRIIPVFFLVLGLSGCGTVASLKDGGVGGHGRWIHDTKAILIYSGVAWDFGEIIYKNGYYALDLPFSFVADTLVLPYTISVTAMDKNVRNERHLPPNNKPQPQNY